MLLKSAQEIRLTDLQILNGIVKAILILLACVAMVLLELCAYEQGDVNDFMMLQSPGAAHTPVPHNCPLKSELAQ